MAMSAEHKAALALGRREARAVKRYLDAIANRKPGRPVTPERLRERIASLKAKIETETDVLRALEMRQERIDAEVALAIAEATEDPVGLEEDFIEHARSYAERKGISYPAWRESKVPAASLKKAGISRSAS
jgi:hypothetical protein